MSLASTILYGRYSPVCIGKKPVRGNNFWNLLTPVLTQPHIPTPVSVIVRDGTVNDCFNHPVTLGSPSTSYFRYVETL